VFHTSACPPGCESLDLTHEVQSLDRWTMTDLKMIRKQLIKVQNFVLFENLIITLQKSPSICFDDIRGLYQTAVNWIQHTFRTSRVLLRNSLLRVFIKE